MNKMLKGCEIVARTLKKLEIEYVFTLPGNYILGILDSIARTDIELICATHEQQAGFMAEGYARAKDKPGVCLTTSGPGVTNVVTSIASAYLDSSPMIIITGNAPLSKLGMDCFQEINSIGITEPITKYNFLVNDVDKIEETILMAFALANSGRKSPVHIDIPIDIAEAKTTYKNLDLPQLKRPLYRNDYQSAVDLIMKMRRKVIYIGGGVVSAKAEGKALALAKMLNCPIVSTLMAISALPHSEALYLGMVGPYGNSRAQNVINNADLIIAIGTRFSDRIAVKRGYAKGVAILHIDIDDAEIDKNIMSTLSIAEDAGIALDILIDKLSPLEIEKQSNVESILSHDEVEEKKSLPARVVACIKDALPITTPIIADVGDNMLWVARHFEFSGQQRLYVSGGLGSMAYSLGAAIGVRLATGLKPFVAIGDGGLLMNIGELLTAKQLDLDLTILLFVNEDYGLVKRMQDDSYSKRHTAVDLPKVDYSKLLSAYSAKVYELDDKSYQQAIKKATAEKGITVLLLKLPENLHPLKNPAYEGITK